MTPFSFVYSPIFLKVHKEVINLVLYTFVFQFPFYSFISLGLSIFLLELSLLILIHILSSRLQRLRRRITHKSFCTHITTQVKAKVKKVIRFITEGSLLCAVVSYIIAPASLNLTISFTLHSTCQGRSISHVTHARVRIHTGDH